MKLISFPSSHLVIPVNHIDFMKWEEMAGGMVLVKVGTGGFTHHLEFVIKEEAIKFYEETITSISEL